MIAKARSTVLIAALLSVLVTTASAAPAAGDAAFMKAASEAVDTIAREDGFSGVILVARGDQVLLRKAAGFADRERNIWYTSATRSPLASVTKQFTAAAIMLLVQDGKIALSDPISKYYSDSPLTWQDVTIKHLLTHGSGIRDYWLQRGIEVPIHLFRSPDDFFRVVLNDPLGFPPGTGFEYSNAGYGLLAKVIEQASGQSYEEFLRDRFFGPLGMRNTGAPSSVDVVKGYVRSYAQGVWENGRPIDIEVLGGAGSLYSTLDDMLIWSRSLETNRILSDDSRAAMFTDYGYNYGFGWRFAQKYGRPLIWHTGNGQQEGLAAIFDRFPEDAVTVVVMTNNTGFTGSTATMTIEGKRTTFPANAARKLVEEVEQLYFGRAP